jgi:hypothetical protein
MSSEKLNDIFEKILEESTKEIQDELINIKGQLEDITSKYYNVLSEKEKLQSIVNQNNAFLEFKSLINSDNFGSILNYFKLKYNNFEISGMDSETIPNWFRWLFHYYEDREKLFVLMDLFNIIYPSWAKEYKMPYDYSEEELEIFINPKYDRHICNGEIFRNNIGFFWKNINCNNGDTYKILINTKSFTDYIPWQLILSNSFCISIGNFK